MREQLPQLVDKLHANVVAPWLGQYGIHVALDVGSLKAQVVKYLNANYEEAFASLLTSLKLGGGVALTVVFNVVLIPVALFYLLMDWNHFVGPRLLVLVPPRARPKRRSPSPHEADQVLGQACAGNCW